MLVAPTVAMAADLDLEVTAEGVETRDQLALLRNRNPPGQDRPTSRSTRHIEATVQLLSPMPHVGKPQAAISTLAAEASPIVADHESAVPITRTERNGGSSGPGVSLDVGDGLAKGGHHVISHCLRNSGIHRAIKGDVQFETQLSDGVLPPVR